MHLSQVSCCPFSCSLELASPQESDQVWAPDPYCHLTTVVCLQASHPAGGPCLLHLPLLWLHGRVAGGPGPGPLQGQLHCSWLREPGGCGHHDCPVSLRNPLPLPMWRACPGSGPSPVQQRGWRVGGGVEPAPSDQPFFAGTWRAWESLRRSIGRLSSVGSAPCGHEYSSCRARGCRCEQPPLFQARTPVGLQAPALASGAPTVRQAASALLHLGPVSLRFTAYASYFHQSDTPWLTRSPGKRVRSLERTLERTARGNARSQTLRSGWAGREDVALNHQAHAFLPSTPTGGWSLLRQPTDHWPAGTMGPCWASVRTGSDHSGLAAHPDGRWRGRVLSSLGLGSALPGH